MSQEGDVKLGQLTRFIFTAPSWKRSLVLILLLGFLIDGAGAKAWLNLNLTSPISFTLPTVISNYFALPEQFLFSGTLAFTIPALAALVLTKPIIEYTWTKMWNAKAYNACSNMPRAGHMGILSEQQVRDLVALLPAGLE